MKKPFGVVAEGLISKNNRGDWTAIELFIAGVRVWGASFLRILDCYMSISRPQRSA
jgi:hypothetical protein